EQPEGHDDWKVGRTRPSCTPGLPAGGLRGDLWNVRCSSRRWNPHSEADGSRSPSQPTSPQPQAPRPPMPVNGGTRHPDLLELLESAREQALGTGAPVLLSMSERVPAIDPLELLAAFSGERAVEAAGKAAGAQSDGGPVMDRMYWARPDEGFAIASIGSAMTFAPTGDRRFASVARAWSELLESAIIRDASSGLPGVGPTLLGGFSFDPRGPRTDLWRAFPAALLNLPRLQMAVVDDSCWLTMNVVVSADGSCAIEPEVLRLLRSRVLAVRAEWGASANLERLGWSDVHPSAEWKATVAAAISRIHAGELEKVVLAREARASASREFD